MKKLAIILLTAFVAPAVMAQGQFVFEDFVSPDVLKDTGDNIGADFSTAVYWGTTEDSSTFEMLAGSETQYFGATGGSPATDGAGLFSAGKLTVEGQTGQIFVQQRIWNGQGAEGVGSVFPIDLATGATPAPTIPSESVQVSIVPEPTSFALAGLGAAALMIFRRRK